MEVRNSRRSLPRVRGGSAAISDNGSSESDPSSLAYPCFSSTEPYDASRPRKPVPELEQDSCWSASQTLQVILGLSAVPSLVKGQLLLLWRSGKIIPAGVVSPVSLAMVALMEFFIIRMLNVSREFILLSLSDALSIATITTRNMHISFFFLAFDFCHPIPNIKLPSAWLSSLASLSVTAAACSLTTTHNSMSISLEDCYSKLVLLCLLKEVALLLPLLLRWLFLPSYARWPSASPSPSPSEDAAARARRLAAAVRASLRVTTYEDLAGEEEDERYGGAGVTCAVCLSEVAAGDAVWELRNCRHVFHKGCLDRWLDHDEHLSCPLCRAALLPARRPPPPPPAEPSWAVERLLYLFGDDHLLAPPL
ncbi:hypothetical protein ZIOFF_040659 [Zingiber officinale]|uniref:RING-type domain-containing protein n=1 Tax=Zingiber officinale TaxID=94328 RepID=A0A8J5G9S8_ZINOF|nr:hypothetical protein ZIOFF_040659 [Zingiber officinale]